MGFTTRPELRGTFGMVASTHWLASAAGMAVLEQGGNAFDAAVAAGLTLQVVEPHLNGPGGDLPAIVWPAQRGEPLVLCAQGVAPRAPTLARTYRQIVGEAETVRGREEQIDAARGAFYRGFVAESLVRFAQETAWLDSSGERHGGLLSADDLARWHATYEPPLQVDYHGHTVVKAGPWSQAPVFLQQLRLLEPLDLGRRWTADAIHTVVECAKLAFADREAWYGDPDFVD